MLVGTRYSHSGKMPHTHITEKVVFSNVQSFSDFYSHKDFHKHLCYFYMKYLKNIQFENITLKFISGDKDVSSKDADVYH